MSESNDPFRTTRDRHFHDETQQEVFTVDSLVDSRASSCDNLILDNVDKTHILLLPAKPYIYGAVAASTTFAYGFNAGIISVNLSAIQKEWQLGRDSFSLTFIVSSMLAGAVLGCMLPGLIGSDRVGRKPMLLVTNVILFLAALGSFFSHSPGQMIATRAITGIGIGIGSIMPGLYITEMSPASIRGFLGILNQFAGFLGILASYAVGLVVSSESHWREMFLMAGATALIASLCTIVALPDSPRWLISHGFNQDAIRVLESIYGHRNGPHSKEEFEKIYAHLHLTKSNKTNKSLPRRTVFTIVALQLIQQAAGSGFVTYYSASIFRSWGLSPRESTAATVLSALPQLLVFGVVAKWAEVLGRKRLLLISEVAMAAVLVYLGLVTFLVGPKMISHWQAGLVFIGLASHRVAYALGLAPVPTVLIAEILPFSLRSHGLAVALTLNWFLNFLITSLIPLAASFNSLSSVYFFMAFCSVISFIYTSRNIKETRGLLLDATEEVLMDTETRKLSSIFTSISIVDSKPSEIPRINPEAKNPKFT